MNKDEQIFKETAEKMNKDFHFYQFKQHNISLYVIIIASMKKVRKDTKNKLFDK